MPALMEIELRKAKSIWAYMTKTQDLDNLLPESFLDLAPVSPKEGWLRACRESQMMGREQAAFNMGVSKQAYAKFEANEVAGTLSLTSLQKAAEAINCELVYFLRPKKKKTFSTLLWEKLSPEALKEYKKRIRPAKGSIKPSIMAKIAAELFVAPEFRRRKNWVRNEKKT